DELRGLAADGLAAFFAVKLGEVRPEQLHVIAQLGHGAHGRTGGLDGIALLDGDGGRDAVDAIHLRLVHAVEKLPRVRAESLDIAPLALGKERVEGERTLARAAETGDDDELVEGKIEVEILEIIVANAA